MRKITMVLGENKKKVLTDNAKKILQKDDNCKSVRGKIFFNAPLPVSFLDVNGPDSTQKRTFFISIIFFFVLCGDEILKKNAFQDYAKSEGKLGGQNKIPRLANDRKIADFLEILKKSSD